MQSETLCSVGRCWRSTQLGVKSGLCFTLALSFTQPLFCFRSNCQFRMLLVAILVFMLVPAQPTCCFWIWFINILLLWSSHHGDFRTGSCARSWVCDSSLFSGSVPSVTAVASQGVEGNVQSSTGGASPISFATTTVSFHPYVSF